MFYDAKENFVSDLQQSGMVLFCVFWYIYRGATLISGATLITAGILLIPILCLLIPQSLDLHLFNLHGKSTQENVPYDSCCSIDGICTNFIFP